MNKKDYSPISLVDLLSQFRIELEELLRGSFKSFRNIEPLNSAISYSLDGGGKRLRPTLSSILAFELGTNYKKFLKAALALEYLHTASLIHDDLPALDDDSLRRGRSTCHVQYNEASAILAGDILVTEANKLILDLELDAESILKMSRVLNCAYSELIWGQQLDLNEISTFEGLIHAATLKTGALFGACFSLPFTYYGANEETVRKAESLGTHIGVCYQIQDDLEDSGFMAKQNYATAIKAFLSSASEFSRNTWEELSEILKDKTHFGYTREYVNSFLPIIET